jgi:cruciform cutting endonuclease 1
MAVSSAPIMEADEKPEKAVLKEMEKESFEPPVLAALAYSVMRNTLLVHNPTHVLIERQRFRSMGSSHILEWTIRVNMLEAMFYAILHTLKMEGHWNGQVVPVAPGKVGPFWLDSEGIDVDKLAETAASSNTSLNTERKRKTRTAKLAKALNKGAKIDLVQNWLIAANRFHIDDPDVKELAVAYRKKWEAKPGTVKGSKRSPKTDASPVDVAEKMGKLDDLADSLLQGMAFIEWEKNKQQARVKGLDSLL